MHIEKRIKKSFVVIGKEGSTMDGSDFIQRLWVEANANFSEVQSLAKKDAQGNLMGIWGAMSDCSHSFRPWEDNFSKGLYLAGVEADENALPPAGWTKWTIPGYEYLCVEHKNGDTFADMIDYMNRNEIPLVGAVHDFTCPTSGKNYLFFPIRIL